MTSQTKRLSGIHPTTALRLAVARLSLTSLSSVLPGGDDQLLPFTPSSLLPEDYIGPTPTTPTGLTGGCPPPLPRRAAAPQSDVCPPATAYDYKLSIRYRCPVLLQGLRHHLSASTLSTAAFPREGRYSATFYLGLCSRNRTNDLQRTTDGS
ncbi:hypothetical protein JOL62DRAFT_307400 [Phyllosticta paracitricarpa]|uniref:Uncharacterized protein n=1 Tax=Phyllosticta paracitricarpa TaxID=2016321 RepID=A0ABR1NGY2_9PEZI